jgi:hypothetical protein
MYVTRAYTTIATLQVVSTTHATFATASEFTRATREWSSLQRWLIVLQFLEQELRVTGGYGLGVLEIDERVGERLAQSGRTASPGDVGFAGFP